MDIRTGVVNHEPLKTPHSASLSELTAPARVQSLIFSESVDETATEFLPE